MRNEFDERLSQQLKDQAASVKRKDVLGVWNQMSWFNATSILAGWGQLDCDYRFDPSPEDRKNAAKILSEALKIVYDDLPWWKRRRFKTAADYFLARGTIPEVSEASREVEWTSASGTAGYARLLLRYQILAANVLREYELDPDRKLSEDLIGSFARIVGIGPAKAEK